MNAHKLHMLFDIAQDLYRGEQKKSGMVDPIPFAWVHNETGELIVYSAFQSDSASLMRQLGIKPSHRERNVHDPLPPNQTKTNR